MTSGVNGGFATIDFETTGLFPGRHHRAIEVAVVHSDPDGTVTGQWETLINPRRDLGAQGIHGVSAREIIAAPIFEQVAGQLIDLLSGRVIVAHNATFDMRFLNAELDRVDYWRPDDFVTACTMRLARTHLGGGLALADCCDAFGIPLVGAHRASADALATARLLEAFIASGTSDRWRQMLDSAPLWEPYPGERAQWLARDAVPPASLTFLDRIVVRIPDVSDTEEQAEYLSLVERCLLDRYLSEHEKDELVAFADRSGIGRETAMRLHRDYFTALVHVAWADGIISDEERADIDLVAALLSIDDGLVIDLLSAPPTKLTSPANVVLNEFVLAPGDEIVLTGEMTRVRSDWEADLRIAGYVPKAAVTKRVAVLVAADPDSLSGKARKAREYGIPVVGEAWLRDLLARA
ncbi:exonuclease domain-containing protein [Microbacterium trichothecenolyticum]|uniref:DNA polymerase-3 subunit epsilon n=1 Tax=Microbacterium trichothecenolyticum TaxID=69370 RepID=A0ABU0TT65_MICTR|nr:exonuclease domain-containing protein [Microbacterium trichothecenolyticum]MDQ1122853.1 DNA polymerase-3 subunit epsilon [Microbacterium trichothecenolyticum]